MTININRLKINAIIGIHDSERIKPQNLLINIRISLNKVIKKDNIQYTVDYDKLSCQISQLVEKSNCYLIETLAVQILNFLKTNKKIGSAWIEIIKLNAIENAKEVSVVSSY